MLCKSLCALVALGLAGSAVAVSSVSSDSMDSMLNGDGVDLAAAASPMWFFGVSRGNTPCYPTAALDSDLNQVPSEALCSWPNVGCSCRHPGVSIRNPGPSFPVYFTFKKCTDTEIRVAYNVFYQKDGVSPEGTFGHRYDWERVIVKWKQSDSSWTPNKIMLSQHSGYQKLDWDGIQNTLNAEDGSTYIGGDNGRKNLDHAKVYVAWFKHGHHNTRNTGWNDIASQSTGNAFRSQDWWYFPQSSDFVRSDNSTDAGKAFVSFQGKWGDASSDPISVHEGLCNAG